MNKESHTTYNKLFILGAKDCTEDDLRDHFAKYGSITKIWKVTNKDGSDRG